MKRVLWILVPMVAISFSLPAFAGHGKCEAGTQECLNMMVEKLANKGWMGIRLDWNEEAHNGTITEVIHGSPAEQAGFQVGDVYLAIEGVTFDTEDEAVWDKVNANMKPGNTITVTLVREGKTSDVAVKLAHMPEDVLAEHIGTHMIEHSTKAMNAEEE